MKKFFTDNIVWFVLAALIIGAWAAYKTYKCDKCMGRLSDEVIANPPATQEEA